MNEVPLIEKVQKNDINTTIIAIKKQLKELNALLGLIDIQSDKQDLSPYVRKDEVIDEVKRFDLSPVTSNAVSKAISYSTTEIKTGAIWLDNKPVYSRVIVFKNIPAYYDIHVLPDVLGLENLNIIKYDYSSHSNNNRLYSGFYTRRDEGGSPKTGLDYRELEHKFYIISYEAISELDVFILYTKTTD